MTEPSSVPVVPDRPSIIRPTGTSLCARVLATHLRRMYDLEALRVEDLREARAEAFRILLHGDPATTSGLLRFVALELQSTERTPWIVVRFSAWRNQRRGPPIAKLVSTVAREGRLQKRMLRQHPAMATLHKIGAAIARSRFVRLGIGLVLAGLVAGLWIADLLRGASGLLVAVATAVGASLAVSRAGRDLVNWLLAPFGSRRASGGDDDEEPADELMSIVGWLGRPVAVVIEEIDPAKASYVVELLDGIAAELRDVPIAYIVAADRVRLAAKYEEEYGSTPVEELIELSFQVSLRVPPRARLEDPDAWLESLIVGVPDCRTTEAEMSITAARTEAEILAAWRAASRDTRLEVASAALARLGEPEVERAKEHELRAYLPLLGSPPSPRTVKRFVNAYMLARSFAIASGRLGDPDDPACLLLWTVLELRWPTLADHLAAHPDDVVYVGGSPPAHVAPAFQPLFADPDVLAVIEGGHTGVQVDPDAIRKLISA